MWKVWEILFKLLWIITTVIWLFTPAMQRPNIMETGQTTTALSGVVMPPAKMVDMPTMHHKPMKYQTETPPVNPTQEVPPVNVDDPTGVEDVTQELTDVTAYTLRDVLTHVLVALGAILLALLGAVGTITYIALKFVHRSVTPEAVKDIFLLGVNKGVQGLTDVAKRLPMPYELDDKFIGAIASGVGRYFTEIGYVPTNQRSDPPVDKTPPPETKKPPTDATPLGG